MQDKLVGSIIIMFWCIGQGNCIMLLRMPSVGKAKTCLFNCHVRYVLIDVNLFLGHALIFLLRSD